MTLAEVLMCAAGGVVLLVLNAGGIKVMLDEVSNEMRWYIAGILLAMDLVALAGILTKGQL